MNLKSLTELILIASLAVVLAQEKNDKKVVCYYTNWSSYRAEDLKFTPKNIDPFLCTHVIYSFVTFKDDMSGVQAFDPYQDIDRKGFEEFAELKKSNADLKLLAALGGWREGSKRFSAIAASKDKSKVFTKGAIEFLRKYKFDGINIDWQFPGFRDGARDDDNDNFASLLQTMRTEFEKEPKDGQEQLLLTISVPSNTEYIDKGFDLPKLQLYSDFITILCYDYHLSTDLTVNHHSPIYALPNEDKDHLNYQLNMDWTVRYILKKGVPKEKLILGIPAYGRTYTLEDENMHDLGSPSNGEGVEGKSTREVGYKAYYEICQDIIKNSWTVRAVNRTAMGPYAYKGKDWVSYDDEISANRKGEYARNYDLGGIMFWAIDEDDFAGKCGGIKNPLINSAKEGFFRPIPTAIKSEPEEDFSDTVVVAEMPTTHKIRPMFKKIVTEDYEDKPTQKPSTTVTREVKEGGNTFYQTISIWVINNVFHLGMKNGTNGDYDINIDLK